MSNPNVEVVIFDTTLRDGDQSLPENFPPGTKPEIADAIANLGVGVIEAGFAATPSDAEEVKEVAKTVGQRLYQVSRWQNGVQQRTEEVFPVIAGISRAIPEDIDKTWEAIHTAERPRIHTFVSTDKEHIRFKFPNMSQNEVQEMGRRAVEYAKEISAEHSGASVEFSAEAASTTDTVFLEDVVRQAVAAGADVVNVPDTVGQRDPMTMYWFYGQVIKWVMEENPSVVISAHNHNDLGQAVANTGTLVQAARAYATEFKTPVNIQLETTVCGLGERAGNADVFPVVANLFKSTEEARISPLSWYFNPVRSVATAQKVMEVAGLEVHRQSPIVGSDILVHRSGIHSDGVIKGGHRLYTPYDPTFWGHEVDAVHEDGKYQGTRGRGAIAVQG